MFRCLSATSKFGLCIKNRPLPITRGIQVFLHLRQIPYSAVESFQNWKIIKNFGLEQSVGIQILINHEIHIRDIIASQVLTVSKKLLPHLKHGWNGRLYKFIFGRVKITAIHETPQGLAKINTLLLCHRNSELLLLVFPIEVIFAS
ncbi:hypothetical protein CEXT_68081 [Caerostris extrusa]|uniref:Uncharacterized protein n=1 Tax=Caerostris extrusa TaxID=172846 RepID=A0AAV4URT4_CAEEX|nr:hypothetical protein CEXT_68081 [Caerostris extrusa]